MSSEALAVRHNNIATARKSLRCWKEYVNMRVTDSDSEESEIEVDNNNRDESTFDEKDEVRQTNLPLGVIEEQINQDNNDFNKTYTVCAPNSANGHLPQAILVSNKTRRKANFASQML
jgi:hypothetical protein